MKAFQFYVHRKTPDQYCVNKLLPTSQYAQKRTKP
jgi:hypothetical protein